MKGLKEVIFYSPICLNHEEHEGLEERQKEENKKIGTKTTALASPVPPPRERA
jgi:hypothetical protein